MPVKLLLVEDDARVSSFVKRGLEAEGYSVDVAADGRAALELARASPYRLIVMDRMLPYMDGLQVCRTLREEGSTSVVLMLTAKDSLPDKLDGLRGGADDYLTKPFAFDELLARIAVLLRRGFSQDAAHPVLVVGDLRLDKASKRAWRGNREFSLTAKEYSLLTYLMENSGAVISRSRLLSEVWSVSFEPGTKLVDVYISYLRRKVDGEGEAPMIRTVRGFGYMIAPAEDAPPENPA